MTFRSQVVVVTGAGQGLGRAEAVAFAGQGASVVVNDIRPEAALAVAEEITSAGGEALADCGDVTDWDASSALIRSAIDTFGRLDVLVNNAGMLHDRPFAEMSVREWDDTIRVNMRGTFCPTKHAVRYWTGEHAAGRTPDARVINTTSPSGLYATIDQTHYGAAKAGIAAFTLILAQEVGRYGIAVNAIAPTALTPMTDYRAGYLQRIAETQRRTGWNPGSPANVAALTLWLASGAARGVAGQVFNIRGGHVSVAEGWAVGPSATRESDWDLESLEATLPDLLAEARLLRNAYGEVKDFAVQTGLAQQI